MMLLKNAIFPPGMQNALTWSLRSRLVSHFHSRASGLIA